MLKASFLFFLLAALVPVTLILLFTTIYEHYNHMNLILAEYWPPDKSFTSIHYFVTNFETVE